MLSAIKATAAFIRGKLNLDTDTAIILGSGLGDMVNELEHIQALPYADVPGFPISTVEGHSGRLVVGELAGHRVVLLQGRHHFYEGYSMSEVVFPTRVLYQLGIRNLMVTNAAGGLNPDFKVGDVMLITDHINLFGTNPLIGKNEEELGPRFPDMSRVYDPDWIEQASKTPLEKARLQKGVYVGVTGPTFETPAEYRYLQTIGGDAVGMSTVPEIIAARHMGMKVFGVSVITDMGVGEHVEPVTHEEVQHIAQQSGLDVQRILKNLISSNS